MEIKIIFERIFHAIFLSKKRFFLPKRNSIVILDSYSEKVISKYIFLNRSYSLLDLKQREIYILIFLKSLFFFFKYGKHTYEVCFLKFIKPKIAITYIDNNYSYFNIFKYLNDIKLIFIQNGNIASNRFDIKKTLEINRKLDYYFILNNLSKKFFEKDCKIRSQYILAGSPEANFFKKNLDSKAKTSEITLISTFRKNNGSNNSFYLNFHIKPMIFIKNVIRSYLFINPLKINILLVSNNPEEKIFFNKIFKNININFIENNRNDIPKNSYLSLNSNTIYIGDSKFLTECLSLGYKGLFISTRGYYINDLTYSFGWPLTFREDGEFWINYPNREKAQELLSKIINTNFKDWTSILMKNKDYFYYDYKNKKIITFLDKILEDKV